MAGAFDDGTVAVWSLQPKALGSCWWPRCGIRQVREDLRVSLRRGEVCDLGAVGPHPGAWHGGWYGTAVECRDGQVHEALSAEISSIALCRQISGHMGSIFTVVLPTWSC